MKALLVGCTGTVGSHVMRKLMKHDVRIRCMTHTPDKMTKLPPSIEPCFGDLDQPRTLPEVFENVDMIFLLNTVSPNETKQGLTAVDAAQTAGVKKIVYLSVYMPEGSSRIPHFNSKIPVENAIKDSPMTYTILRPNNFYQNDEWVKDVILKYGIYPHPIGSIGLNRIDVRDIADAAVNALIQSGHDGRTYSLHGPDILTGHHIADIYSRVLGRDVIYAGNDLDAWVQRVRNVMPHWMVRDLRVMYKFFQDHGMVASVDDLNTQQKIIGHEPRRFEEYVNEVVPTWAPSLRRAA